MVASAGSYLPIRRAMTARWEGASGFCPAFPDDGTWSVQHEGFTSGP